MPIPAAQYLRMSTEHQQYSLKNQSSAIERYAEEHELVIVRTYSDAARSGLVLNRRLGLRSLLQDVVSGDADYAMILVYDVSRWGRFQDIDESGHYEFICRSAGVPVHYVAEPFENDGTLASMIMKALKRMMAGEYSRELSVKVFAGAKRLASLGFKQGGIPGYGLRRLLISATGERKQELAPGERKNIQQDRVVLTPGPAYECYWVREIFRMYTEERKFPLHIARELNQNGVRYEGIIRRQWYAQAVNRILRNPKYIGTNIYGRYSQRLHTPRVRMPDSIWTVRRNAWPAIVDEATFQSAQRRFSNQTCFKSDEQLIAELKLLLARKGKLSERHIMEHPDLPAQGAYRDRFGSMSQAFALAGYHSPKLQAMNTRRGRRVLRDNLIGEIVASSEGKISVIQPDGHWRPRLRLPAGLTVSIYLCPRMRTQGGEERWILNAIPHEARFVSLIARLNGDHSGFIDFFVLPDLRPYTRWTITRADEGLKRGLPLGALADLMLVAKEVRIRSRAAVTLMLQQ